VTETTALLLSIAVEAAAAALLMRAWQHGNAARAALAAATATLLTHGAVWTGVPVLAEALGYGPAVLLAELAVVAAEAPAYRLIVPLAWRDAAAASLVANATSTGFGLALYALGLA
jgi:hypothetical protein